MARSPKFRQSAPDAEIGNLYIKVLPGLRAVRTLRSVLVDLAYKLRYQSSAKSAALVLANPAVSDLRLEKEWEAAVDALRPELGSRLWLLRYRDGAWRGFPRDPDPSLVENLRPLVRTEAGVEAIQSRGEAYFEILKVLIYTWLNRQGPITADWLAESSGTSYPTVASALRRLGPAIRRHSNRKLELEYFPREEWARMVATAEQNRSTRRYVDRSGQQRSPESLLRRLEKLARSDVAVGGVVGAKYYDPDLDLAGIPNVQLTVHAPDSDIDLSLVSALDPGLQPAVSRHEPALVSLHFLRRHDPFFVRQKGINYADPVECLLDLYESHLDTQAKQFLALIMRRRESLT